MTTERESLCAHDASPHLKFLPDIKLILLTIDLRLHNIQIFDNDSSRFKNSYAGM
jgi:hypothetical protein